MVIKKIISGQCFESITVSKMKGYYSEISSNFNN